MLYTHALFPGIYCSPAIWGSTEHGDPWKENAWLVLKAILAEGALRPRCVYNLDKVTER